MTTLREKKLRAEDALQKCATEALIDEPIFDRAHHFTAEEALSSNWTDMDLTMDVLTDGGALRLHNQSIDEDFEEEDYIEESRERGEITDDNLLYSDEAIDFDAQPDIT